MTASLWFILGLLTWLVIIGAIIALSSLSPSEDDDADEAVDSCHAALHECEPRRVRAGS